MTEAVTVFGFADYKAAVKAQGIMDALSAYHRAGFDYFFLLNDDEPLHPNLSDYSITRQTQFLDLWIEEDWQDWQGRLVFQHLLPEA